MNTDHRPRRASTPVDFPQRATIRPWPDPIVDRRGHDPRSLYVEYFWLGVIGPTATWLLRRIAAHFDARPEGGNVDLHELAGSLGLSVAKGPSSPFGRALQRCVMFGAARPIERGSAGWEVRRRLPTVTQRHLRKLPESVRQLHAHWDHSTVSMDDLVRAQRLAQAMVETGDAPSVVEAQLRALGIATETARVACDGLHTGI
jgi:hypothetical protein